MPLMDGFQLCRTIKEDSQFSHIPFIFYSASYTEPKDREFGLSLGADEYISKPIEPDVFLSKIRKVFERWDQEKKPAEETRPLDNLSYYTSYADVLGRKLDRKVVESEQHRIKARYSEEKYRVFLQNLQGIGYLVQVGVDLPLVFEGQVEEVSGYPAGDFLAGTIRWENLVHLEDHNRYLSEKFQVGSRLGNTLSAQYRIHHKNGEIRWVHEIASNITGTQPDLAMIQGAIYDITAKQEAEQRIRKSEEHFRYLFENMAEGVVYQDKTGAIIGANLSAERILGLTRDQLLGRESIDPRWRSIHEDLSDFPGEEHPCMVTLRTGEKATAIMGVYNPNDDRHHWILINAVPVFKPEEKTPYQVFTTFEDITREQEIKNALHAHEKQYRELVESVSDILFIADKEGKVTYISPVVTTISGLLPSHVIGNHFLDFVHPDDQEMMKEWFLSILQNQITKPEFRCFDSNRQILYLTIKANPVFSGNEIIGVTGIIVDITIWKQSEKLKEEHAKETHNLLSLHLLATEAEDRIFSFALDAALDCTESRLGFIAFLLRGKEKPVFHIWSPDVLESCGVREPPDIFGMSHSSIWTECITKKKSVIVNDFSSQPDHPIYPKGHLPIFRFLTVPVIEEDTVKAIIAVANRGEEYTGVHANTLASLGNTLWDIINRKRTDQEIKRALYQISQNMEQLATLNDTIRNPLAILAAISDLIDPDVAKSQMEAIQNIDSVITMLDQGWIQSEKVRNFLIKHYQFKENEF